ncbi:MFS transporter [Streptomyces sp. NPDC002886]|uniref:MFS transporter n=1 Tax=Streptomyces sp. NPDC002886 TaxID=3364667 RepID=UPI00368609C6
MSTATAVPPKSDAAQLFWKYWLATTVSEVGSAMTAVALPLVAVMALDATVLETTLLAATSQVSWLILSLPAGVIVQRVPLRSLQVTLDLVRLVAIGSVPVAWWLGQLTYPHVLLAAFISGLATVLFAIGNTTFLPAIIEKDELSSRNSLMSGTLAVTQTGGPSLSGLLIQLTGPVGVLAIDAVSFLVSAITLRTLPERRPSAKPQAKPLQLIREGWNFVVRHPVMRPAMIYATLMNLVNAALVALTPLYLVREVKASATVVGLVIAMDGVGALLGSAVATKVSRRVGTARAMILASAFGGTLALAIPLTTSMTNISFYGLGMAGFSFGAVIGSIMARTHRQTDSPPELLSRVMATVRFISWGALPVGAALSGVLASATGLRTALWITCAGTLVAPLTLLLSSVGRRRELSDEPRG